MTNFKYFLPTEIIFGKDSISDLEEIIKKKFPEVKRILLVTGQHSLKKAGITDKILKLLENFTVVLFDKVEANPTSNSNSVNEGTEKYKRNNCEMVLAIGGGSVIDAGKAIAVLAKNNGSLEKYQGGEEPKNDPAIMIAVPTTSGTSSEMTTWSVITNLEGAYKNTKKSFSSIKMYPKIAIIDPKLTLTLSKEQTASTGLDALSHAIEGYWSKKKNPLSDIYAIEAIKIIKEYLPIAYKDGENIEAREKMSFATLIAGLCFSNSRTSSPHKVSYPITTQYNLPHGAACMITLPYFMAFIGENEPEQVEEIVKALGCKTLKEAVEFLKNLVKNLGMPNKLSDLGITKEEIAYIAKNSYVEEENQEDPVKISYEKYLEILKTAL
jgi:alcohol dehydrogenase class IV